MPERGSITIWIEHLKAVAPLFAGRLNQSLAIVERKLGPIRQLWVREVAG